MRILCSIYFAFWGTVKNIVFKQPTISILQFISEGVQIFRMESLWQYHQNYQHDRPQQQEYDFNIVHHMEDIT